MAVPVWETPQSAPARKILQSVLVREVHQSVPVSEIPQFIPVFPGGIEEVVLTLYVESLILHPCAFYSKKLSPVERNYGIGNQELLVIKLTLEEWRH